MGVILCTFPGIGKGYIMKNRNKESLDIVDFPLSKFIQDNKEKYNNNSENAISEDYVKALDEEKKCHDVVFATSNKLTREIMFKLVIEHFHIVPHYKDRNAICNRLSLEHNDRKYSDKIKQQWNSYMTNIDRELTTNTKLVKLDEEILTTDFIKSRIFNYDRNVVETEMYLNSGKKDGIIDRIYLSRYLLRYEDLERNEDIIDWSIYCMYGRIFNKLLKNKKYEDKILWKYIQKRNDIQLNPMMKKHIGKMVAKYGI